jgi:hypothetical protein
MAARHPPARICISTLSIDDSPEASAERGKSPTGWTFSHHATGTDRHHKAVPLLHAVHPR